MGFRGLGCLLVATTLALVGCRGDAPGSADAEGKGLIENPRRPVQLMLRQRAERLRAGDVEGYLAGLAPEARAFEEPIARTAVTLPLDRIDLTIGSATISDDGTRFRRAHVTLQYNFKELPRDNPFRLRLLYEIERQEGRWIVTKAQFDLGPPSPPPPLWATGPVELTRSAHFLAMHRPGVARVDEVISSAEAALERLLPKLSLEADPRHLIVLARDGKEYADLIGGEVPGSVAATGVEYHSAAGTPLRPEERHIVVNLQLALRGGAAPLEESKFSLPTDVILQHELGHLVLSRFDRPCTEGWVSEGGAMFLSGERRTAEWAEMVSAGVLDEITLADLDVRRNPFAYPYANAAVLYLIETGGVEKFFDFYQNYKNLPEPGCTGEVPGVRARLGERLLRRHYGLGIEESDRFALEELDGFTRDYIRKAVATP